jgi:hypothetical protein
VGSGGASIREPRGGAAIDRHEAVFRFNFAQTAGYEGFVGSKTTIRIGNHITTRAFDEVIRRSTQPNARLALNAKGWNCDEFIQWPSRYPASIMSLCNVMHDPPFYVMRSTFVREMREMYGEICALLLDRPKCVPTPLSVPEFGPLRATDAFGSHAQGKPRIPASSSGAQRHVHRASRCYHGNGDVRAGEAPDDKFHSWGRGWGKTGVFTRESFTNQACIHYSSPDAARVGPRVTGASVRFRYGSSRRAQKQFQALLQQHNRHHPTRL